MAAAVIHGSAGVVIGVGSFVLLGVGIIYVVIGFGLLEIAIWALRHLRAQLSEISTLVARPLPVLLILVVFLLFASELWQAAHTLGGGDLAAVSACSGRGDRPRGHRSRERPTIEKGRLVELGAACRHARRTA